MGFAPEDLSDSSLATYKSNRDVSKIMDNFEDYLKSDSQLLKLALTDPSYRNYVAFQALSTNESLSTFGDAILRFILAEQIYDEGKGSASERRKIFENNHYLVSVIAKHYSLLDILRYDRNDIHKQAGYSWDTSASRSASNRRKSNPQKYIADAMEAVLAAYYLDCNRDIDRIRSLIKEWESLIREYRAIYGNSY